MGSTNTHTPDPDLDYPALARHIKHWGQELGFQQVGISDICNQVAKVVDMQNMTNKPWTDKEHAKDNWNQYRAIRENAKADRQYGRSARSLVVKPRFWSGSRNRSVLRRF